MISLPQSAQLVINALKKAGYQAYAVGGSVRDILMNRPTKSWDFTTNATPEEILAVFPDSFYDNQFGTVGVKIKATGDETKDIYEITTFRSEKGYSDRRHPDTVTWGKTLEEDLSRRDFTINAIATDGKKIVDPYEGQKDLDLKLIRAVGNPQLRFQEDALRLIRAVRIATELGFMIEPETFLSIKKYAGLIKEISAERIKDELLKLLSAVFAADGILLLKNTGLLNVLLPELDACFGTEQKSPQRHHIFDVGTHLVESLRHCKSQDLIVRLATLLHDVGKPPTFHRDNTGLITFYNHEVVSTKLVRKIVERLRLSNKQSEKIIILVRWHQFSVDERQTDSALRRFIRRVGKENLDDMLALRIGDRLGGGARETSWRLELYKKRLVDVQKQPFTVADLKIDGFDVMKEFVCKPGPLVGKVLNQLFSEVESGTLNNDRKTLLTTIKKLKKQQ
ncbi:HD domain-containing protein [Patescibacteria group bacterium]|nr:HD domain-containing protein [Patescibacteria group bacterium]MBU1472253.1 HD domain-containing protein [Patescibacteria group bacterium]MBU2460496.1 HD domain-containing protein [Patescibacteria group bacterium]MBU2544031.1 HD domain-containing protein [Patescibacteria group bacterium]